MRIWVDYAYPTSTSATKFGFARTGCYVVQLETKRNTIPKALSGHATRNEAEAEAERARLEVGGAK